MRRQYKNAHQLNGTTAHGLSFGNQMTIFFMSESFFYWAFLYAFCLTHLKLHGDLASRYTFLINKCTFIARKVRCVEKANIFRSKKCSTESREKKIRELFSRLLFFLLHFFYWKCNTLHGHTLTHIYNFLWVINNFWDIKNSVWVERRAYFMNAENHNKFAAVVVIEKTTTTHWGRLDEFHCVNSIFLYSTRFFLALLLLLLLL